MPITDDRRLELNQNRAETLVPELKDILIEGLEILEDNGWKPLVATALRSMDEQAAIFAQSRESLDVVNALRKKAGLDPINESENAKKVTNAKPGQSKHNYGKAFDLVNINDSGRADWDDMEFYSVCNNVFKEYGLLWGNDFAGKFKDIPHWEL